MARQIAEVTAKQEKAFDRIVSQFPEANSQEVAQMVVEACCSKFDEAEWQVFVWVAETFYACPPA